MVGLLGIFDSCVGVEVGCVLGGAMVAVAVGIGGVGDFVGVGVAVLTGVAV